MRTQELRLSTAHSRKSHFVHRAMYWQEYGMYVIMCQVYQVCDKKGVTERNLRKVTRVCTSDILCLLVAALSRDGVKFVATP